MELETINRLFLELSQFTTAQTGKELQLEAENKRLLGKLTSLASHRHSEYKRQKELEAENKQLRDDNDWCGEFIQQVINIPEDINNKFTCPLRNHMQNEQERNIIDRDIWKQNEFNGNDYYCSYCGSIHPSSIIKYLHDIPDKYLLQKKLTDCLYIIHLSKDDTRKFSLYHIEHDIKIVRHIAFALEASWFKLFRNQYL